MNNKCIVCNHKLDNEFFSLTNAPFGAQTLLKKEELSNDKGINLSLKRCPNCGLVQFDCEPVPYYKSVIRAVGISDTMQKLRKADFDLLINQYGMSNKKWFECGCGDGSFIDVLKDYPVSVCGSEYNFNNTNVKKTNKENIFDFFPENIDDTIPRGPFDVFLSFNFLEHQINPLTMLRCLYNNLNEDGLGLITVPSFEYIYSEGYYYEFVRDHIAYYDLASLTNLCSLAGFDVIHHDYIGIKDTLRVIVKKGNGAKIISDFDKYNGDIFYKNYQTVNKNVQNLINALKKENKTLAVWGASHQSFTLLSTTSLADYVSYIIDSSPFKQGLYSPVSHLPIVAKEHYIKHPVDCVLIAAPGYIKEISLALKKFSNNSVNIYNIFDLSK